MKILGVGLSRTGSKSLNNALLLLGYRSIHFEPQRLKDVILGTSKNPEFRRYNDVDAVTDIPAAYFYRELQDAYPECKFILTVRDVDSWFESIKWHFEHTSPGEFGRAMRKLIYGAETKAIETLFKKKFQDHNEQVVRTIPKTQLLIMNILEGDGWEKLCPFLGVPVPEQPFPHVLEPGRKLVKLSRERGVVQAIMATRQYER